MSMLDLGVGKNAAAALAVGASDMKTGFGNSMAGHSMTSVPAGALVIIMSTLATGAAASNSPTSSPVLTFTKQADVVDTATEIHTAVFSAGGSITVTTNWADGSGCVSLCLIMTGQEGTLGGASAAIEQGAAPGFGSPVSGPITTTRANSIILGAIGDRNAATGTITYLDSATEINHYQGGAPFSYFFYKNAASITTYTEGLTSPNVGARQGMALYEIRTP